MRRGLAFAGLLALLLTGVATPAWADPARPTTYHSEVEGIDPPLDGVTARVVGGDSFLQLTATSGTTLEVPGYEGEPYLRFEPDGTVLANRRSPAFWLNEDRFGQVGLPPEASAEAEPEWEQVGAGGTYAWHDHRIHWMSPQPPPGVDRSERSLIQEWAVPIVVDGEQTEVRGVLEWVPAVSPLPWLVLAAAAAGLVWWLRAGAWGLLAASVLAGVIGLSQALTAPMGLLGDLLTWLPPALALVASVLALARPSLRGRLLAIGALVLGIWAALRISSLWMPVLPSPLAEGLERGVVAIAVGAAAAALVLGYRALTAGAPAAR